MTSSHYISMTAEDFDENLTYLGVSLAELSVLCGLDEVALSRFVKGVEPVPFWLCQLLLAWSHDEYALRSARENATAMLSVID